MRPGVRHNITFATFLLASAVTFAPFAACETYDPPPEVTLKNPPDGKWYQATPLTLVFTEPIDPSTLVVTVWPNQLDEEGFLVDGVQPIVDGCSPTTSPCGEFTMTVSESGNVVTIDHGTQFDAFTGSPLILDVHEGLKDLSGRERKVPTRFTFQINPTPGEVKEIQVDLQTGVFGLFADLSEVLPGVYLRMFVDIGIHPTTGETWLAGTVAQVDPEAEVDPNTSDPSVYRLYHDDRGWTIFMSGMTTELPSGAFFLETDPYDMKVKVLGLIDVELQDFRMTGTLTPGGADDGSDLFEGFITSTDVLMNDTPLGEASAPVVAFGRSTEELPEGLPRLCDTDPCAGMIEEGGDCQLAKPWTPGPSCETE